MNQKLKRLEYMPLHVSQQLTRVLTNICKAVEHGQREATARRPMYDEFTYQDAKCDIAYLKTKLAGILSRIPQGTKIFLQDNREVVFVSSCNCTITVEHNGTLLILPASQIQF